MTACRSPCWRSRSAGALLADAGDAGQAVGGVAAQHRHVQVAAAVGHAVALLAGPPRSSRGRPGRPCRRRRPARPPRRRRAGAGPGRRSPRRPGRGRRRSSAGRASRTRRRPRSRPPRRGPGRAARAPRRRGAPAGTARPGTSSVPCLGDPVGLVGRDEVGAPGRAPVRVPAGGVRGGGEALEQHGRHVEVAAQRVDRGAVGGADAGRAPRRRRGSTGSRRRRPAGCSRRPCWQPGARAGARRAVIVARAATRGALHRHPSHPEEPT